MFEYVRKLLKYNEIRSKSSANTEGTAESSAAVSTDFDCNVQELKNILGNSPDVIFREFELHRTKLQRGILVFINELSDKQTIETNVLKPLMSEGEIQKAQEQNLDFISKHLLTACDVQKVILINDLVAQILGGCCALLIDGEDAALSIQVKKWDKRAIGEPATENLIRGPREGFTETLNSNISMLRRIVKNPNLRFETMTVGEQTKTDVMIAYIQDIANTEIIQELRDRISRIQTDSVLDSGYIQAFIEDAPTSIFQTVGSSERPDAIAGKLLEGRVAVFVEGSPFVLTVPMLFIENFQTTEDYYVKAPFAVSMRIIRVIAYFIAVLAPALYVALTTFHQELIPTTLLFTLVAGHENIPFPSYIEAVIMLVIFDIMKEAGLRLPKSVGSAVSIVGALVLGQAAVSAGLIGPFMVIIVALTAVASFVLPSQADSGLVIRYFLLLAAGFLGGFGIVMGMLLLLTHLVSIHSFGVPFLSPISPYSSESMKDVILRAPLRNMFLRPEEFQAPNRQRRRQKPE